MRLLMSFFCSGLIFRLHWTGAYAGRSLTRVIATSDLVLFAQSLRNAASLSGA
jgi:hypothetical protein